MYQLLPAIRIVGVYFPQYIAFLYTQSLRQQQKCVNKAFGRDQFL